MSYAYILKGNYVVAALIVLTCFVGGLFIVLGPKATEKNPGVLHVGIRFADERSIEFTRFSLGGPGARIEFINNKGELLYHYDNLKIGRNLVPIEPDNLPSGRYLARLSADEYKSVDFQVIIEGRMLNPAPSEKLSKNVRVRYNMIGVRFESLNN